MRAAASARICRTICRSGRSTRSATPRRSTRPPIHGSARRRWRRSTRCSGGVPCPWRRASSACSPSRIPALATPDLEYHVQPLSTDRLGDPLHSFPAITVSVCNLRPESMGSCHITTPDLDRQPSIRPNYLSTEGDRAVALRAVRQARKIMTAKVLARYRPTEILPGPKVESDADLLREIGNIATTIFHPIGTCRMGPDGMPWSVPICGFTGWTGSGSSMPRSCRESSPETPHRRWS